MRYISSRQLRILGARMGSLSEMKQAWSLVETGQVKAIVDKIFSLDAAAEAQTYLESRQQFGKVVLSI